MNTFLSYLRIKFHHIKDQKGFNYKQRCLIILLSILSILLSFRHPNYMNYKHMPTFEIQYDFELCNVSNRDINQKESLKFCDIFPEELEYYKPVVKYNVNDRDLERLSKDLQINPGGKWSPMQCQSQHQVAIVVPLRNRESQLKVFLYHIHSFLQKQLINYQIFVVEQTANYAFNKGILYNAAYLEINKIRNFCCFILNDVDLLPESPKNMYTCSKNPRHLCANLNTFRYVLLYSSLFGGVVSLTKNQFNIINGFSNRFFGWGGEDDDFLNRINAKGMDITRWDSKLSRYSMLFHPKEHFNPERQVLLETGVARQDDDGLNNVHYKLVKIEELPLYTSILIDLGLDSK